MMMVIEKDVLLYMHLDYRDLNKMTNKDKLPISIVDELHGDIFFTKLDLHSRYHQIGIMQ